MTLQYSNNATTTLAGGITSTDTTITLAAGAGGKFPVLGGGQQFYGTLSDSTTNTILEIVLVTARIGDSLTVVRGQDGTTATSFNLGDSFSQRTVAAELRDFVSASFGATVSGPIDFLVSPTAPTVALTDNSQKVATTAYVNQLSLSQTLPNQLGNAGKYLRTDGTNATWQTVGISNVTNITTTTTLTSANLSYHTVAMASATLSVTLPDATGILLGGPRGIFRNTGSFPFGIRDNVGGLITAVDPGGIAYLTLEANGTAAGTWSVEGNRLAPGLITVDAILPATLTSTLVLPQFVALDSNVSVHFANLASGFAAFAMDAASKTVGTPVTVDAGAGMTLKTAFRVSNTSTILFYDDGTTSKTVMLSLTGSNTLTLNVAQSAAALYWGGATANENFKQAPSIAQLSPTLYLAGYLTGGNHTSVAISVSGVAITVGTPFTVISSGGASGQPQLYPVSATTGFFSYPTGGGPYNVGAVIVTVTGTTCTAGTPVTWATSANSGTQYPTCALTANKYVLGYSPSATQFPTIVAATVSGTTITVGTPLVLENTALTSVFTAFAFAGTRYNPRLAPLTATTLLATYQDGSAISRAMLVTESSGTLTSGAILYGTYSSASAGTNLAGSMAYTGVTDFMGLMQVGIANAWTKVLKPHRINGTTITNGTDCPLTDFSKFDVISATDEMVRLSSGDYVVVPYSYGGPIAVARSNGDYVNLRGYIRLPSLYKFPGYPVPLLAANRIGLLGAMVGSNSASVSNVLRIVSIEIAQ